jgi:hypothetical protein
LTLHDEHNVAPYEIVYFPAGQVDVYRVTVYMHQNDGTAKKERKKASPNNQIRDMPIGTKSESVHVYE